MLCIEKRSNLLQSELVGLKYAGTSCYTKEKKIFDHRFNNSLSRLIDLFPNQNKEINNLKTLFMISYQSQ